MMKYFTYILLGLIVTMQSCDKYLNIKPRSNLVIPETLDDMEQLLDNGTMFTPYPELLELQADDFYLEETYWNSMVNQVNKSAYTWEKDIYGTTESHSAWSQPYSKIFYANAVLDGLKNIERNATNHSQYDQIKGSALFLKAEAIYVLAQLFAKVYDQRTADSDLGVPIPMSADVNEAVYRPSMQYTFDFITNSLVEAEKLMSPVVDFSRPSKAAAHAMLARVYLYMGYFDQAFFHSDSSLQFFDDVIDLNDVEQRDYKRTLLFRFISPGTEVRNARVSTFIDSSLMMSYHMDDKRRNTFFALNNTSKFIKRSFHGLGVYCFSGYDADEQFLIRAECYARNGQVSMALEDLNHLLERRIKEGEYIPYESDDKNEVLDWVLMERRKELVFRGLRWSDLKRLNREEQGVTLVREIGGTTFTLPPNDHRWVLPIPLNELNFSGLQQNER